MDSRICSTAPCVIWLPLGLLSGAYRQTLSGWNGFWPRRVFRENTLASIEY